MQRNWIGDMAYALLTMIALMLLPAFLPLHLVLALMYAAASRGSRNDSDVAPTSCRQTRDGEDEDSSARTLPS